MTFREGDSNEDARPDKIEGPGDEEDTKVRLDAEDDDDADEGDEGEEKPEQKAAKGEDGQPRKKDGTWAAKKAERGKDRKAAKQWETEKADYDRRLQRMQEDHDRSIRQLREDLDRTRQTPTQQQTDPLSAKLTDLDKQLEQELKLIESDPNHGYGRYRQISDERNRLIARQEYMHAAREAQRNQPPPDPYSARRPIIESEYPWVVDDRYRELAQAARAYKEYLVKVERRPDTIDTDREALAHIQAKSGADYGLRSPAPPSPRTRNLYAGPASRGTPDRRPAPREVDLGPMGQGHGLSPNVLQKAVRSVLVGDDN